MNISQMFRNFGNNNLQQLQNSRQVNQQPGQQQIQNQNQSQSQNQVQRDQYIPQGNMTQESAGIYSPSEMSQAQQMPRDASGQFVERDNEAVSFNPYTFNPQAMNEARTQELPAESERPEGMTENGEFSEEMPDLPPIPEDEDSNSEISSELPENKDSGNVPPAKVNSDSEDKESDSESESINTMSQRPSDMKQAGGAGKPGGAAPVSGSEEDDDDDDSELEKLEQERTQLTQKLNTERDDSRKAALRVELQSVESQIVQLKAQLN